MVIESIISYMIFIRKQYTNGTGDTDTIVIHMEVIAYPHPLTTVLNNRTSGL